MTENVIAHDSNNLIRLPANSVRVDDPDEEIFLLYTHLSSKDAQDGTQKFTGLGSVDSKHDTLAVRFELPPSTQQAAVAGASSSSSPYLKRQSRKLHSKPSIEGRILEIELQQDKTALRTKKGDTGSVLWRVSVVLGQALLRELCSNSATALFNRERLKECDVLELGAGTGLLSLILSPWVRHYTATDLDYLVPLIRKNVTANLPSVQSALAPAEAHRPSSIRRSSTSSSRRASKPAATASAVSVEPLDWLQVHATPPHARAALFRPAHGADPPDIVLAADCVYNPTLVPAFLAALERFAAPGRTRVLVAVELRAVDVVREFLERWIGLGGWEIWRVGGEGREEGEGDGEGSWLGASFAVWVGWKVALDGCRLQTQSETGIVAK
ncbi:hypothetical protein DFH11DRAFT_1546983 [Phellopilus nigrolimitatus]|nr:hypothetical protein DFH11DRAFT_1546983 [Phellopilus nigrolimitatus]